MLSVTQTNHFFWILVSWTLLLNNAFIHKKSQLKHWVQYIASICYHDKSMVGLCASIRVDWQDTLVCLAGCFVALRSGRQLFSHGHTHTSSSSPPYILAETAGLLKMYTKVSCASFHIVYLHRFQAVFFFFRILLCYYPRNFVKFGLSIRKSWPCSCLSHDQRVL